MKSQINDDFLAAYRRLPKEIREQARKAYRLFQQNPQHPSLNFKSVHPSQPFYSARISRGYRTVGIRSDDVIIWSGSAHTLITTDSFQACEQSSQPTAQNRPGYNRCVHFHL